MTLRGDVAMRRREDPPVVEDDAAAVVAPAPEERRLPRPGAHGSNVTVDDVRSHRVGGDESPSAIFAPAIAR